MFCGKCGTQNQDSAAFCVGCGQPLNAAQPAAIQPEAPQTAAPVGGKPGFQLDNRKIGIIAVAAVVAIALIITCMFIFGGGKNGSPEAVVDTLISAINKGSAKDLLSIIPEQMTKMAGALGGDFDEMMQEYMEEMQEDLEDEFGKGWKASAKVLNKEKLDKDDLEDLQEMYDMLDIKIKEAYVLEVEMTMKGKDDKEVDTAEFTVIKIDGKWYLDFMSMGGLF